MAKLIKYTYIVITSIIIFSSCTAYKKIPYLKDVKNEVSAQAKVPEARIFPNDLLTIIVNTTTPEAAYAFNLSLTPNNVIGRSNTINSSMGLQSYLVESDGTINFPVLGKISVIGKTKKEVELYIKERIFPKYITEEPIIHIRFANYQISILGEVKAPGNYNIFDERVSIFDALALAGDMTMYGKRKNILIVREKTDGTKETYRINLQDKNIMNSPFYYLQQNDVVYVEPNKHQANSSAIGRAETLSISVTSTLISLTSLLITVFK